jgi:hypothetical protein
MTDEIEPTPLVDHRQDTMLRRIQHFEMRKQMLIERRAEETDPEKIAQLDREIEHMEQMIQRFREMAGIPPDAPIPMSQRYR